MAKRKYKRRGGKKNNSLIVFFVIVIGLVIISFAISYFLMQTESGDLENNTDRQNTESSAADSDDKLTLEGTWASYNDGAMLTIKGRNFSIEQPSVESSIVAYGRVVIHENRVTFVYTDQKSLCGIKPGVYEFKFDGNEEVEFIKVDDTCTSRSNQIVASWFKV